MKECLSGLTKIIEAEVSFPFSSLHGDLIESLPGAVGITSRRNDLHKAHAVLSVFSSNLPFYFVCPGALATTWLTYGKAFYDKVDG